MQDTRGGVRRPAFASLALRGLFRRLGLHISLIPVELFHLGGGEDREVLAVEVDSIDLLAVLLEASLLHRAAR